MGPPSGALRECQPGRPRVPYRRMSNSVHHAQACIGSTRGQRDPLQLAEHSGDAAGIVPAIADVPGRGPSDKYISARSSDLKICLPVGQGLFFYEFRALFKLHCFVLTNFCIHLAQQ